MSNSGNAISVETANAVPHSRYQPISDDSSRRIMLSTSVAGRSINVCGQVMEGGPNFSQQAVSSCHIARLTPKFPLVGSNKR
jgi:hypothetical protein